MQKSGLKRDDIENKILNILSDKVFDESILPEILSNYNDYAKGRNNEYVLREKENKKNLVEVDKKINNIVDIVTSTGFTALLNKLKELEEEKLKLEAAIHENKVRMSQMTASERNLKAAFKKAKQMLRSGTLKNKKAIIEKYIKEIVVYKDKIEIEYTISDAYSFKDIISKEEINNIS